MPPEFSSSKSSTEISKSPPTKTSRLELCPTCRRPRSRFCLTPVAPFLAGRSASLWTAACWKRVERRSYSARSAFRRNIPGLPQVNLFAGGATGEVPGAITVYDNTIPTNTGPQLDVPGQLNSGQAVLVGVSGQGQAFCASCNFLNWGAWLADVDFQTNQGENGSLTHQVHVAGWWVSGDLPTIGQLPLQGTATYSGTTYGTVAELANSGWVTRTATGGVQMNWDFGQRAGNLAIKNFDANGQLYGPLNVQGRMDVPGQLANSATNKFSGPLLGTLGVDQHVPNIGGVAAGSFAANGADKTAGVTGNFAVGNSYYKASGIFGAGRDGAVDPNGHLELPPATQ